MKIKFWVTAGFDWALRTPSDPAVLPHLPQIFVHYKSLLYTETDHVHISDYVKSVN